LERYEHVIFATHVPPFPEASVDPSGKRSDGHALPWYCNVTLGWAIDAVAAAYPHRRLTVLAGHCHGAADVRIAPNLRAITGAARYGTPSVSGVIEIDAPEPA
jgi:hypothetical protein